MKKGLLTLVPTPIDDENPLESVAFDKLMKATTSSRCLIAVEDPKPARRRWIKWGLPREAVDEFIYFNEHSIKGPDNLNQLLLKELLSGKDVFLLSDGGLPAVCDPGQQLVELCHSNNIQVTATPFSNSIILALALSGMKHDKFYFNGFLPVKKEERLLELKALLNKRETKILMDTPYRLNRLLCEIHREDPKLEVFLGMDLNQSTERLLRARIDRVIDIVGDTKAEFILILGAK